MSWDAYLYDDRGHCEGEWGYTHNTNRMIAEALKVYEIETPECGGSLGKVIGPAWWYELNDKPGPEGAAYLDKIIRGLEGDPMKFQEMNPPNGWGDYDSLLKTLRTMRASVPEWPTVWSVHG